MQEFRFLELKVKVRKAPETEGGVWDKITNPLGFLQNHEMKMSIDKSLP